MTTGGPIADGPAAERPATRRPFLLGVAGGTASGKTTVAGRLAELVGAANVGLITLDAYYMDNPHLSSGERAARNYDHPDAFDWPLLVGHLRQLCAGQAVEAPLYDFTAHRRRPERCPIQPTRVIVVEGILILYEPAVRELLDLRVYVDSDADIRFIRRLERDLAERGRTVPSVISQYLGTVRPGHLQFVEPSKRHADVIIPHGGLNAPALDVLLARVRELAS